MPLKKNEKERIELARKLLDESNITFRIEHGSKHTMLCIGPRKLTIPSSECGPKWRSDVIKFAQGGCNAYC